MFRNMIDICMKPQFDAASGDVLLSAYLIEVVRTRRIVTSLPISNRLSRRSMYGNCY
jgi:hypothetical protein